MDFCTFANQRMHVFFSENGQKLMNNGSIGSEIRVTDLPEWGSKQSRSSGASKSVMNGRRAFRGAKREFLYDQNKIFKSFSKFE